jgi:hypothetical protein
MKKKANEFDPREESSQNKKLKVGRKPRTVMRIFFLLKRKLFRKLTAAMIILKKKNWLLARMILKKINQLMETRMSTLKKL